MRRLSGSHYTVSRVRAPDADRYIELTEGRCHYRYDGPANGARVLLIHGATVPAWEFDRLVPWLHRAGYRTLRPDLFGHGYSDRPRVRYQHVLFVRQLFELIERLDIAGPMPIIGHSLGAALAARLIGHAPARFSGVVLGAPLVDYLASSPAARMLCKPMLGELLMSAYVVPMLRRRRRRNYRLIEDGRFVEKFMSQLEMPGFGRALLSMFRCGALGDQIDCYRELARLGHPTLLLTGARDAIVSDSQVAAVRALLPQAHFRQLADTAHAFMLSDPQLAAPHILDFLERIKSAKSTSKPE